MIAGVGSGGRASDEGTASKYINLLSLSRVSSVCVRKARIVRTPDSDGASLSTRGGRPGGRGK